MTDFPPLPFKGSDFPSENTNPVVTVVKAKAAIEMFTKPPLKPNIENETLEQFRARQAAKKKP